MTLSQAGLAAAIKEIRSELAAMSNFFVDYNKQIPDDVLRADMTKVITAYLTAAQKGP
jgi:hypothetical protein